MDATARTARPRRAAAASHVREPKARGHRAHAKSAFDDAAAKAVRRIDWHPSAPQTVLAAVSAGDPLRIWRAWRRHLLASRNDSLTRLLGVERSPLLWALPAAAAEQGTSGLIQVTAKNDRAARKRFAGGADWDDIATRWLDDAKQAPPSAVHAIESLAWCHALSWLAADLSPHAWSALFEHFIASATDSAALTLASDPLLHQLYAGELPLTLACRFPDIKNTRAMRKPARRALSRGPLELLNGEGLPTWADLAVARPLLACWTRCAALGDRLQRSGLAKGCWDATAQEQFRWFVAASLRLARSDGSQMFLDPGHNVAEASDRDLFAAALALAGGKTNRSLARLLLPKSCLPKSNRKARRHAPPDRKRLPPSSYHCEWSGVSLLRPKWRRGGTRLGLAFGGQHVQLELCSGRDVVLSGAWDAAVELDGRRLAPVGAWEESCWISDRHVDYVELQLPLAENVVLERHIVLPRDDDFLLLVDSVVGRDWRPPRQETAESLTGHQSLPGEPSHNGDAPPAAPQRISYRATVPLAPGVEFVAESETREGVLRGRCDRALVVPLALSEWRSDFRVGSLSCVDGTLELHQSNAGASLVAPQFFDLRRKRFRRERTWRQLTVAEEREIQPPDRAAGFRVQVGNEQWIVYRSLTARGNRTLLAHNLSTEFLVARFAVDDGASRVDPLVEIE